MRRRYIYKMSLHVRERKDRNLKYFNSFECPPKLKQVLIRNFVFDKITYNFALDLLNWNNVFCYLATLWAVMRNKHVERERECVVYLENEIKI